MDANLLGNLLLVGAGTTATNGNNNVDESAVELDSLLCSAQDVLVLLLLLGNLGRLVLHLTGTGQRAVHLACVQHKMRQNGTMNRKRLTHQANTAPVHTIGFSPTEGSVPVTSESRPRRLTSTQTQHQVQRALLLNVVVAQRAAVLQLLASEDKTLLVRGDALLVLNLLLHVLDRVAGLHIERDGLAGQGLPKYDNTQYIQ